MIPALFCLIFLFYYLSTSQIDTLSLHDALPISCPSRLAGRGGDHSIPGTACGRARGRRGWTGDRKSTRLNSSHTVNSYAVFCLKKKNGETDTTRTFSDAIKTRGIQ